MIGSDGVRRTASVGVKNPVAALHLEGPAKKATLQYGYGEVRYSGLLRDVFTTETTSSRPLEVFLAGAGFTLLFEDGKTARLESAGLGARVALGARQGGRCEAHSVASATSSARRLGS